MATLDEIASDPSLAASLSEGARRQLWRKCAALLAALAESSDADTDADRQLTAKEAAELLGWPVKTLQARARKLAFARQQGRRWYFSRNGLQRFIKGR